MTDSPHCASLHAGYKAAELTMIGNTTQDAFYGDTLFHRVIDGFMVRGDGLTQLPILAWALAGDFA